MPRFVRTSSFRLTLAYAGIFCLSFAVLFGVIFWTTADFMTRQIDQTVASEIAEIRSDLKGGGHEALRRTVETLTQRSPGFYYLAEDAGGNRLAGNLPPMRRVEGVSEFGFPSARAPAEALPSDTLDLAQRAHEPADVIRGQGVRVADGDFLFVGLGTAELRAMQRAEANSFFWGGIVVVLLALAGGAAMSIGVLRRVDLVSRTSREIMAGDLARRVPLHGTGDEFDRLGLSLNAMLDRIQGLMEDLQQLSTNIAHDLKTPLSRLRQRIETTQDQIGNERGLRANLDAALTEIDHLLETFGALIRIAQIEAGARRTAFTRIDLTELLRTLVEVYLPDALAKGQTLSGQIADTLWVWGDQELLAQMVANLIENAVRHAPPGAQITVRAGGTPDRVEIGVADTGPGIPSAQREKVFQRFYRLEASRTTPGSGLGLSLVSAIATLHGIELDLVDNEPGLLVRLSLSSKVRQETRL